MWAIPGGMVDPGEYVSTTLKREFMEEALNILGTDKGTSNGCLKINYNAVSKWGEFEE